MISIINHTKKEKIMGGEVCDDKFMSSVKVGAKGKIVIPKED